VCAAASGRPRGLRRRSGPLAFRDCGLESNRGYRCLSVVSVVCVVRQRSVRRADHLS